jgi:glyoxylase-like metal-dependent hydrolase (beta-lactamase superfamily II)
MKKLLFLLLALVVVLVLYIGISYGPGMTLFLSLREEPLDDQLMSFIGYGGNSIILSSTDKSQVMIVDTKIAGGAKKLAAYVLNIKPDARVTIVNTHFHGDHTAGNRKFPGAQIIAGAYKPDEWFKATGMDRLPDIMVKVGEEQVFAFGDDTVHVRNVGRGHTWNDVVVYLQNRKLLMTGDLVFNGWHPALFAKDGANVQSWTSALDTMLKDYDIKTVIPGHGSITDSTAIVDQKNYFISISAAIGNPAQLEEVKKRYKGYFSLPGGTSMKRTIEFIRNEEKL